MTFLLDVQGAPREPLPKDVPPYNGFGSLQDSLQSCLSLVPQPPKKDFIKMLENDHKVLRYAATMVSSTEYTDADFVTCVSLG